MGFETHNPKNPRRKLARAIAKHKRQIKILENFLHRKVAGTPMTDVQADWVLRAFKKSFARGIRAGCLKRILHEETEEVLVQRIANEVFAKLFEHELLYGNGRPNPIGIIRGTSPVKSAADWLASKPLAKGGYCPKCEKMAEGGIVPV